MSEPSTSGPQASRVRPIEPRDVEAVLGMVTELAEYEKLGHELQMSAEQFHTDLFGDHPRCEAMVAEVEDELVGYALFFSTYSTFKTRVCLFLEDLCVRQDRRGEGHGRQLLASVASVAADRKCARMMWNVLDWNRPAILFYQSLGAEVWTDWRVCCLAGDALERLAETSS